MTLRLKNKEDDSLQNLNVKMRSIDSLHISFRNPHGYIFLMKPNEEKYLHFQVDANTTSHLYISIRGRKNGMTTVVHIRLLVMICQYHYLQYHQQPLMKTIDNIYHHVNSESSNSVFTIVIPFHLMGYATGLPSISR